MNQLLAGPLADMGSPQTPKQTPPQIQLRLMATTDLHACILPYDYCTETALPGFGLARTATLIAAARAEAANHLLLDNGDFLQGTALGDYLAQARGRRLPHPVIAAFNALGYDAGTLGNHEFNYGLRFLRRSLADARHPVVSANIAHSLGPTPDGDDTLVAPFVLLDRRFADSAGRPHDLRIGIIGFTPPQTLQWDRQHLAGRLAARDIVEAARGWVPVMRAQGADLVIALSHSGIGDETPHQGMENASTALAAVPGIDAIIAGHSHLSFPSAQYPTMPGVDPVRGTLSGKPAVLPGHSGSHLGIIDLTLSLAPGGGPRWQVSAHHSQLRATPGARPAAAIRQTVQGAHRAARRWSRRPIGETTVPLSSYFAQVAGSTALALVAAAQRDHVAAALADHPAGALPILSAVSPFKTGGRGGPGHFTHIPPGPLALRHAADLYVFPNAIAALRVTGAEIRDWLDRAAGQFLPLSPDRPDSPLIDAGFPSFNFDQILGLSYEIDLTRPAVFDLTGARRHDTSRILNLRWNGAPLDPAAEFVLATNSYRANGSAGFAGAQPDRLLPLQGGLIRDILARHIAQAGPIGPLPRPDWRLVAPPGTSAIFLSHPQAAAHLDLVPDLRVEGDGLDPAGFGRFRLRF